jgi:hypothetical protein
MSGLGAPVLEAYSAGYDPERYYPREHPHLEDSFDDWSDNKDVEHEKEA